MACFQSAQSSAPENEETPLKDDKKIAPIVVQPQEASAGEFTRQV
jgi:hypothetical protein